LRDFPATVQTAPTAHPSSCTTGTVSLLEAKRPGRGVNHPPALSAEVNERVELCLFSPSGTSLPVVG